MRQRLAAFVMVLALGGVARADDWRDCAGSADSNRSIQACTNIIVGGRGLPGLLNIGVSRDAALSFVYINRGAAYRALGDYDRAIADQTEAIELSIKAVPKVVFPPKYNTLLARASFERARSYEAKGDYDSAIADYTVAIRDGGPPGKRGNLPENPVRSQAVARVAELEKHRASLPAASLEPDSQQPKVASAPPNRKSVEPPGDVSRVELGRRVALVIGNAAYQSVPQLVNPTNDAKLIADALRQDGFGVTVGTDNLSREGLINALKAFATEADKADWAVVYFAGHGIEMGGTNYLIPVDAKLLTDRDVDFEAVPLGQVMSAIEGAHVLRVVILDACRDNPFEATMKRIAGSGRNIGRGLARVEPAQGTVIVFSAKAGTIAADGDGANSPFAAALAQHLTAPGVEVGKLFRLVRDDVLAATGNKQEVFQDSSLPGTDFFFRP